MNRWSTIAGPADPTPSLPVERKGKHNYSGHVSDAGAKYKAEVSWLP